MELIESDPELPEYLGALLYWRRELPRTPRGTPKTRKDSLHLFNANTFLLRNDSWTRVPPTKNFVCGIAVTSLSSGWGCSPK